MWNVPDKMQTILILVLLYMVLVFYRHLLDFIGSLKDFFDKNKEKPFPIMELIEFIGIVSVNIGTCIAIGYANKESRVFLYMLLGYLWTPPFICVDRLRSPAARTKCISSLCRRQS